jgi:hypothetical protein
VARPSLQTVFQMYWIDRRAAGSFHGICTYQAKLSDLERNRRGDLERVSLVGGSALKFMKILNAYADLPLGQ